MNCLSIAWIQKTKNPPVFAGCSRLKSCLGKVSAYQQKILSALLAILVLSFVFPLELSPQTIYATVPVQLKHSPRKASIYSAILPGLGQAYNRKYWKIPIIYGGFGALFYITRENILEYNKFQEAYLYVVNEETTPIDNEYVERYNEQQLLSGKKLYRRNMEVGYILAGVLYILNIIDASVDAHLHYYDISEDLSMKLQPVVLSNPLSAKPVTGFSLTLRF